LEVPQNAAAAICKFCNTQHKLSFHDGVLIAEIAATVKEHSERLSDLETSDGLTQQALGASTELMDVNLRIKEIEDELKSGSGGETAWYRIGCGCLPLALLGAMTAGVLNEGSGWAIIGVLVVIGAVVMLVFQKQRRNKLSALRTEKAELESIVRRRQQH